MSEPTLEQVEPPERRKRGNIGLLEDIMDVWNDPVEMKLPALPVWGTWWTPMPASLVARFCKGKILVTLGSETPIRLLDREELEFVGTWWVIVLIPTALAKNMFHMISLGADSIEIHDALTQAIQNLAEIKNTKAHPVPEPAGYT